MTEPVRPPQRRINFGVTAAVCVVFAAGMVGASFAAVPLYRIFCSVTGYNGTVRRAEAAPTRILDKTMTVRFDANVSGGLGWDFAPDVREVKVKIGEVKTVSFHAENLMSTTSTASAAFNVSPDTAGGYFNKLACFCFTQQTLPPHTPTELPVTFFIDPSVVNDVDMSNIDTVTLSYTFYPAAPPAQANAAAPAATGAVPDKTKPL
ncbi:MAG TPA: cytochrome c oxidase assembly protein [Bauldia sp.]|nr:cytochrome c oxidase assembly protein [Bauldia sp.]